MKDKIKTFYNEHKNKALVCLCFVSVYVIGVASGIKFQPNTDSSAINQIQSNSSIKSGGEQTVPLTQPTGETNDSETNTSKDIIEEQCLIKGNIGSGSRKVYHMPGGSFYDRTQAEMCFLTEQEAVDAGFEKSSR